MNRHLSEEGVSMYLIGNSTVEDRQHTAGCAVCQAKIANLTAALGQFRGAVRTWSDGATTRSRAAELRWTVLPAADHLERLLLPDSARGFWLRSLWGNIRDLARADVPPPGITSRPVLVRDIWEGGSRQKKSWALSVALQSAAVCLLFTAASTEMVQRQVKSTISLVAPDLAAYQPKPAPAPGAGGGGGGDRSALPASKGRVPSLSRRQFTPPMAEVHNAQPKLLMEPTIVAPEADFPQVNIAQYGDPLAQLGSPSNGPGFGGGIGTGSGGGIGSGRGPGFGPGEGGGVGGGVFRVGGGVTAPSLVYKVEPEYSEEARKAKYQGVVVLYVVVDPTGRAQSIRVLQSLGLGLDEKAIEAVSRWRFKPGHKDGRPVPVAATIEVNFRLL